MRKSPGYILILTLLLLSTSFILLSSLLQKVFSYSAQSKLEIDIEYARQIALSGIQIALSQISLTIPEKKKGEEVVEKEEKPEQDKEGEKKESPEQKWLAGVLNNLNSWKTVNLDSKDTGIDATIVYHISSQQGKFNISKLTEPISKFLSKGIKVDIFNTLKESKKTVQSIPELVQLPGFESLKDKLFLDQNMKEIAITDLLCVESQNLSELNPWLLSEATSKLLVLQASTNKAELIGKAVAQFRPNINWTTEWDKILAPIFGKKFKELDQNVTKIFSKRFIAESFLVISHGTVNSITQKVAAIVRLNKETQGFAPESKIYTIAQLYWI